jgi:ParB/RepB/Spo0J family partition protein
MSPKAQAATLSSPTFTEMLRTKIEPSPTNPRRFFNQEQLVELAESVRTQGVLEPLLVRPVNKHHEIVAGERRWRAAEIAGLKVVPVLIREMTDDQVLDAQIHENLHRADIHPMDEAFGYQHLLKVVDGLSVEELARRVGKSAKYVAQRLSLVTLIEPAVKDFMEGLITLGHATQIARLPLDVQPKALDQCYDQEWVRYDAASGQQIHKPNKAEMVTVGELRDWIEDNLTLDLKKAPWSLEDAALVPEQGACSTCQFNTANNLLLFADAATTATCTNAEGYKRKMKAFIESQIAKLKADGNVNVLSLTSLHSVGANEIKRYSLPEGSLSRNDFNEIEKKKDRCQFALPGVFFEGNRRGQVQWVCTEPKCKDHKGRVSSSSSSSRTSGGEKSASEKKKMYDRKQELFDARVAEPVRRRVLRMVMARLEQAGARVVGTPIFQGLEDVLYYYHEMAASHFARIPGDTQAVLYEVWGWDDLTDKQKGAHEWGYRSEKEKKARLRIMAMNEEELFRFLFLCSVVHVGENLGQITSAHDQQKIVKTAEAHGVNYKLFDARERLKQNPGKKYGSTHKDHLLRVLLGEDVKRPVLYGESVKLNTGLHSFELEQQVMAAVTLKPFVDGPDGIAPVEGSQDESKPDLEIADELLNIVRKATSIHQLREIRGKFTGEHALRSRPLDAVQLSRISEAFTEKAKALPGFLDGDLNPSFAAKVAPQKKVKAEAATPAKVKTSSKGGQKSYTEAEAATQLGISTATLKSLRKNTAVGLKWHGSESKRGMFPIYYTPADIEANKKKVHVKQAIIAATKKAKVKK